MIPYIVFYIIVFILSFGVKEKKLNLVSIIFLTLIILFSALRACGTDYHLYNALFQNMSYSSLESSRTGIGFDYLELFMKEYLHLGFQSVVFLCSIITNCCVFYYLRQKTNNPGFAMLVFISAGFYTTSFNMFRQSTSISLILIFSLFVERKKYIKATLLAICAMLFHTSSLIAIVVYLLMWFLKNRKIKTIHILLTSALGISMYSIVTSFIFKNIAAYSIYLSYDSAPGLGTYMNVLIYIIIAILFLLTSSKKDWAKQKTTQYYEYNLFFVGIIIVILELKNFLFFRIAIYFTYLLPVLLANYYECTKIKNNKSAKLLLYSALFIYYLVYISSFDGVIPYKTFLI